MTQPVHVCTYCGSPRVFADAWAALNTDEVRTYDACHCDDCEGPCRTKLVEVSDDFDLEVDFYKEKSDGETLHTGRPRDCWHS